jgi:hypothetical protein
MSKGFWTTSTDDALKPERYFNPGERIIFNPPPGAYSSTSLQRKLTGKTAIVRRMVADDYLIADFDLRHGVLLNASFVESEK